MADVPDPASLERAVAQARENGVPPGDALDALARVAGLSRSLGRWLSSHPGALARLITPVEDRAAVRARHPATIDGLKAAIRERRLVETARILLRDLDGAPAREVAARMAEIASDCFSLAVDHSLAMAYERRGPPLDEAGAVVPFVVIGMGKLGGRELNLSSDVDVIYVYGTDRAAVEGGAITSSELFANAATSITRALADPTEDGVAFRVDLDLRPEGTRGPVVNSLRSLEVYYESYGRTWERAAWLKARPVAGDPELGAQVLRSMEPFVFRKWLDFSTLDAIREMKDKIDRSRASKRAAGSSIERGYDVKLGAGGIRELEFFVQALQLVNAGKRPELRETGTLDSLKKLADAGLAPDAERLARSWEFLRRLEHRLQARELAQTHTLPTDDDELGVIAVSMGFPREGSSLLAALASHRAVVAEAFDGLFREKGRKAAKESGPEAALLSDESLDEAGARALAEATGLFSSPAATAEAFARIRRGPARSRQKDQAFRYLGRIAPVLFAELRASPDADAAVLNLERFLSKIGGRTTLLALLAEHPPTLALLARLFGSSDFLSNTLIARPELLDVLVGAGTAEPRKKRSQLRRELAAQLAAAGPDAELRLDAIRRFRTAETLRIGIADLWGHALDLSALQSELSHVAETVVESAVAVAGEMEGLTAADAGLVVLGLGRFGGREMAWGSDVDLVFFCEDLSERHVKLAQRVISALSAPTREGIAYRVDSRLRPSGSKGPLVVSRAAFRSYHEKEARTWERQALTRARPVAGSRTTWEHARREIRAATFREPDRAALASEVSNMRDALEKQIGRDLPGTYNLKTGRGGLVDVEFAAQYLQLLHGFGDPFLRAPHTWVALSRAHARGRLGDDDFRALSEGYVFLSHLENRLRIVTDHPTDEIADDPAVWARTAKRARLANGSGDALRTEHARVTTAVRESFLRVLSG